MEFTQILNPLASFFSPSPLLPKPPIPFTVMLLSPHPDDECITSSLALRLMLENNAHVVNIAITLGSNKDRHLERTRELEDACRLLQFENIILNEKWPQKLKELKSLIQKYQPDLILAPHLKDYHPTHTKTGELLKKAIQGLKSFSGLVAWTEFWGVMDKPNLLVEVPTDILNLQMEALSKHIGEISRNPYHIRLPGWMMDNVRRGSEVIGGKGVMAPRFPFGIIYKIQLAQKGKFKDLPGELPFLTIYADLAQIFKLILEEASGSKTNVK